MRHKHHKAADEAEIDMTPMLDIVFIMLIFFIVTASFLKESGVDINRPDSSQKSEQDNDNESIFIDVTDRNEVWINKRRVDIRAVRPNVERLKAKLENPSVVVKAHPDSETGRVLEVVDGVREAGVFNYVVATPKSK